MDSGGQQTWSYVHGPYREKLYVVNNGDDSVTVIDTDTFTSVKTITIGNPFKRTFPNAIFASATGHKVYVSHAGDTQVTIIDSLTDEVIETLPIGTSGVFSISPLRAIK